MTKIRGPCLLALGVLIFIPFAGASDMDVGSFNLTAITANVDEINVTVSNRSVEFVSCPSADHKMWTADMHMTTISPANAAVQAETKDEAIVVASDQNNNQATCSATADSRSTQIGNCEVGGVAFIAACTD